MTNADDRGPWPSGQRVSYFCLESGTSDESVIVVTRSCPSCGRISLEVEPDSGSSVGTVIWPVGRTRPIAEEISAADINLASDMQEAAAVLPISPKASAALARRALQHILLRKAGVTRGSLNSQIDEILDGGDLPTALAENVDAIRVMGNFAAHPIDSKDTGAILSVEPGEAEFTLEILWEIAEHYYVRPERLRRGRNRINRILQDADRPPLKGSSFDDFADLEGNDDEEEDLPF